METKTIEETFTEERYETRGKLGVDVIKLSNERPHTNELFTLFYDVGEEEVLVVHLPDDNDIGDGGPHNMKNWSDCSDILFVECDVGGTTVWKIVDRIPKNRFIQIAEKLRGVDK